MDILERIRGQLAKSPYPEVRTVQVHLEEESVVLTGCVKSFYAKQLAQEAARSSGNSIDNRLQVL